MSSLSTLLEYLKVNGNAGNYDITKLHYEGPGDDVPGAPGGGYGYEVRTGGQTSILPLAVPA